MKQLLVLGPQEIQSGIYKVAKAAVPLWADAENVIFRDLGVRKTRGALALPQLLESNARSLAQAYARGEQRIYAGTDRSLEMFKQISGIWQKSKLYNWPTAGQYADIETWGTWLIATNGVDPVVVWKDGTVVPLAGVPFTKVKVLKRKTPFLLAFNTNNIGDTGVEWSSDSDPETWTPSTSNKAGNYNIRDLESEILAVVDLGDNLAIYSRSSMSIGRFLGGNDVWGFSRGPSGVGAVSRRSVVTVDPFNYGLTRQGIFKTDGISFQYVDDPAMTRWIKDTADWNKASLFWGFHDTDLLCATWYFLDTGFSWHSISYYYNSGVLVPGNLQLTAGIKKEVLNFPVVAGQGKQIGTWQESEEHFDAPVEFSIKTKPLDFGARGNMKLLQLVRVDGQWTGGNLRVCALDRPEGMEKVVFDKPLRNENYFEFEAPYFTLEFYGDTPVYVTGIEIFGEAGGVAL